MGLYSLVLSSGGYRGGFCKNLPEHLSPCLAEPKTAGSKVHVLLTKLLARQIRDGHNTPVTTYLRKKESYCTDVIVSRAKQS